MRIGLILSGFTARGAVSSGVVEGMDNLFHLPSVPA